MSRCLYPDCEFTPDDEAGSLERLKRIVIDHINNDHDDAHVLIACAHDFQHAEDFTAATVTAAGVTITMPMERLTCPRCLQHEVRPAQDAEPKPEEGDDG